MRPTKYLGLSRGGRWSSVDRTLAEGLEEYEASLNSLGIPFWIARDSDRKFTVDEIVDHSVALLEETRAEMGKGDGEQHGLLIAIADGGPGED